MKKCLSLLLVALMALGTFAADREHTLKVYNWADYIDEDVLNAFPAWYKQMTGEDVEVGDLGKVETHVGEHGDVDGRFSVFAVVGDAGNGSLVVGGVAAEEDTGGYTDVFGQCHVGGCSDMETRIVGWLVVADSQLHVVEAAVDE